MTEAEWLGCEEPMVMLEFLRRNDPVSNRKWLLFQVAAARRLWHMLEHAESRVAVETVERYADGQADVLELRAARDGAEWIAEKVWYRHLPGSSDAAAVALYLAGRYTDVDDYSVDAAQAALTVAEVDATNERIGQAGFIRDIFGNPFRPVTLDPDWLTPNVFAIAATIYDARAFDRLPILADALLDAGCDSAAILDHCRGSGPHVRGCWVVDLILGRE